MSQFTSLRVVRVYTLWIFTRAILHRGWWLVASLYFIIEAQFTPFQLVFVGTAQALTALLFEMPAGVVADRFSRKWSLVLGQLIMGLSMLATGWFSTFPALVLTQMLWGLSWTFLSGADAAWLTDELRDPGLANRSIARAGAWEQVGGIVGIVLLGALAWLTSFVLVLQVAGLLMMLLGGFVAGAFPEKHFAAIDRKLSALTIFRQGLLLARDDRAIQTVLVAITLISAAEAMFTRLYQKGLVDLGLPPGLDPVLWFTLLAVLGMLLSAIVLRCASVWVSHAGWVRLMFAGSCLLAGVGLAGFALAAQPVLAMVFVIVVNGVAWSLLRMLGVIWANSRVPSAIRATLLSLLSQVEHLGKIVLGTALGVLAQGGGMDKAMWGAACIMLTAAVLVMMFHSLQKRRSAG
ncbi:MAG: MFS transporter [Pseudomonadota bacterium]